MDLEKYLKIFVTESEKYLSDLESLLFAAEKRPGDSKIWQEIYGKLHSIKGMARALNLEYITKLAHLMEDLTKGFYEKKEPATDYKIDLLLKCCEMLHEMAKDPRRGLGREQKAAVSNLIKALKGESAEPVPEFSKPENIKIRSVNVSYALIEELLGFSQEIMLFENRILPLFEKTANPGLARLLKEYSTMIRSLHFRLAHLRLISLSDFLSLFERTVREMARQTGKKVTVKITGGEIRADITLLERIKEPLIHIIRNAIVHGIESPHEREALGKPEEGIIRIKVARKRDRLIVSVKDDGRGIDEKALRSYLIKKKGITKAEAAAMQRDQLFETLFIPGFSTSDSVSDMAGRGIGMDVVRQAVEYLGGRTSIDSTPLKGTEIIIELPLSLSVTHALIFTVEKYMLAVPVTDVISVQGIDRETEKDSIFMDLERIFGVRSDSAKRYRIFMSTERGKKIFVNADKISGNQPIMVMPVGEIIARTDLFSGIGLTRQGETALVLETARLIETGRPLE